MCPVSPGALAGPRADAVYTLAASTQGASPDSTENPIRAWAHSSAADAPNWTSNTGLRTEGAAAADGNSALATCPISPIASWLLHVLGVVHRLRLGHAAAGSVLEHERDGEGAIVAATRLLRIHLHVDVVEATHARGVAGR